MVVNGEVSSENGSEEGTRKQDTIIITGKPENCQAAKKALLVSPCSHIITTTPTHNCSKQRKKQTFCEDKKNKTLLVPAEGLVCFFVCCYVSALRFLKN